MPIVSTSRQGEGALSDVDIANEALTRIGQQNEAVRNQSIADMMATGMSAVHTDNEGRQTRVNPNFAAGEISPCLTATDVMNRRASMWDSMREFISGGSVTGRFPDSEPATTNSAAAPAAGLTIDTLRRARELLERNSVPDDSMDAMLYGRSPAASALSDVRRYNEEMMRNRGRPLVDINFERRPDRNASIQVTTHVRELMRQTLVDAEYLDPSNFQRLAAETAREFAGMLEVEITHALIRAHDQSNQARYGQNRATEAVRHMVDMAPGALNMLRPEMMVRMLYGDESPEKKGAIASLKDFKNKTITHNGWTAKVLDTYEAIKTEGREMSHCLGAAYVNRIDRGEYVAVHITAPEGAKLPQSGFTLGFHRKKNKLTYDQLKGKKNDMHHCKHSGLLWFVDMVEKVYAGKALPAGAVAA